MRKSEDSNDTIVVICNQQVKTVFSSISPVNRLLVRLKLPMSFGYLSLLFEIHSMSKEILNREDIETLVDTFYIRVREDHMLNPVFSSAIGSDWAPHLEKMYRFWSTVLLGEHSYSGSPFPPHSNLPIDARHFERWLELFHTTVDELFIGAKADEAKWRADNMARMFQHKLQYFKDHPKKRPLT